LIKVDFVYKARLYSPVGCKKYSLFYDHHILILQRKMELIERDGFLELLQAKLETVAEGEGHCVFISGEAGIGKTAMVKAFCRQHRDDCSVYQGACDALFTPRPLAPLYDIIWQVNKDLWPASHTIEERFELLIIKKKKYSLFLKTSIGPMRQRWIL
jgi:hypothetical protein